MSRHILPRFQGFEIAEVKSATLKICLDRLTARRSLPTNNTADQSCGDNNGQPFLLLSLLGFQTIRVRADVVYKKRQ